MSKYQIAEVRRAKGWSQQQLAEALGSSQQQVARWETGQRDPKTGVLLSIANALGVSVTELLGIKSDAPADALTPDERELLALWRATTDEGRAMVMDAARSAARRLPLDPAAGAQRRPA